MRGFFTVAKQKGLEKEARLAHFNNVFQETLAGVNRGAIWRSVEGTT